MNAYKYDSYQPTKALETSTDASQVLDADVYGDKKHEHAQSTIGIPDRPIVNTSFLYQTPLRDSNSSPDVGPTIAPGRLAPFRHENAKREAIAPVIFYRKGSLIRDRYIVLNKWEGKVTEVREDSFIALLLDQDSIHTTDEEAEFPIDEVPIPDRPLIEPGAIFYWSIGYIDKISGQRMRVSDIRFRRLPVWSSEEIERAKKNAQRVRDLLNWK